MTHENTRMERPSRALSQMTFQYSGGPLLDATDTTDATEPALTKDVREKALVWPLSPLPLRPPSAMTYWVHLSVPQLKTHLRISGHVHDKHLLH
jgi:hypothetical protein